MERKWNRWYHQSKSEWFGRPHTQHSRHLATQKNKHYQTKRSFGNASFHLLPPPPNVQLDCYNGPQQAQSSHCAHSNLSDMHSSEDCVSVCVMELQQFLGGGGGGGVQLYNPTTEFLDDTDKACMRNNYQVQTAAYITLSLIFSSRPLCHVTRLVRLAPTSNDPVWRVCVCDACVICV